MLANPKYPKLPAALASIEGMRKFTKVFLKTSSAKFDPPVKLELYQAAGNARAKGLECVTHTFGIFLIKARLPSVQSVVERVAIVKHFDDTALANKVTVSVSIVKALAAFKQCQPVPAVAS